MYISTSTFGSVWVLALALVSLKLETKPRLEVVLKTNQF